MASSWTTAGLAKVVVAFLLSCFVPYFSYKMGARSVLGDADLADAASSFPDRDRSEPQLRGNRPSPHNQTQPCTEDELPSCARDVFLTLRKELGGDDEHSCRGLLISEDIMVTTRACSEFKFTFDFPGFGVAQAIPHTLLNSKDSMAKSRLGFLKAAPPRRSRFLGTRFMGKPARRTPMFLSDRSASWSGPPVVVDCVDGRIPVARNFPVDGELIPLGPLSGAVPDEILWEEEDLQNAVALSWKGNRWWTRPIDLEEEEDEIWDMIDAYRGPPGSISIPTAHTNFLGMAGGLFEAVDPRGHRRGDCFKKYFVRYYRERPFGGARFFDWLDFGQGKRVLRSKRITEAALPLHGDHHCVRENWNGKTVHYFNERERREHEVYLAPSADGGALIARYRHNDAPVPESDPEDPHLYMWDLNRTLYVVDSSWDWEKYGTIKHTAVLAGGPALSAGKAYFGKGGAVWGINYSSGHYRPDIQAVAMMYQWMKDRKFNTTALHWVGRDHWKNTSCADTDWDAIEIPGFDCRELERACHEVRASPTWVTYDDV